MKKLKVFLIVIVVLVVVSGGLFFGATKLFDYVFDSMLQDAVNNSELVQQPQSSPAPAEQPAETTPLPEETESGQPAQGGKSAPSGGGGIDYGKLSKIQQVASAADKARVYSIVLSCLTQEEIKRFSGYLKDGVTAEEQSEVMSIVSSRIKSSGAYSELMGVYYKYLPMVE